MSGLQTCSLTCRGLLASVLVASLSVPRAGAQQTASSTQGAAAAQGPQINDLQLQISAVVLQQAMNAAQQPAPTNQQLQLSSSLQPVLQRQLAVAQQQLASVRQQVQQLQSLRRQAAGVQQQPLTLTQSAEVQSMQQKLTLAQIQNALLLQQLTLWQQQLQTALQQAAP